MHQQHSSSANPGLSILPHPPPQQRTRCLVSGKNPVSIPFPGIHGQQPQNLLLPLLKQQRRPERLQHGQHGWYLLPEHNAANFSSIVYNSWVDTNKRLPTLAAEATRSYLYLPPPALVCAGAYHTEVGTVSLAARGGESPPPPYACSGPPEQVKWVQQSC